MSSLFEKFTQESDWQGLSYVANSRSKAAKLLWSICLLCFIFVLLGLFTFTIVKYLSRPMGIDQKIETKPINLPEMYLCYRWAVYSDSKLRKYKISHDLARVLQWRIEATYLVEVYPTIDLYRRKNRTYKEIASLLERTREEYLNLTQRLNVSHFESVVQRLLPTRFYYPWMKIKNSQGEVKPTRTRLQTNEAVGQLLSYYEVEMGFATFICEPVVKHHGMYAVEIPITFPEVNELYQNDTNAMTKIFLHLARLVTVKDIYGNVIARIRPGTNAFVTYNIRTFKALDSNLNPCIHEDDGCDQECGIASIQSTFAGCRHCQSIFTRLYIDSYNGSSISSVEQQNETLHLCDPWEFSRCNFSSIKKVRRKFKKCQSKCKPMCKQTKYSYQTISDKLEEDDFGQKKSELSRVIIEPEKGPLKYIQIQQYELMDLAEIFSDFGGYLGFFLGSSLLTVVHLLVFCVKEGVDCCCRIRPRLTMNRRKKFTRGSSRSSAGSSGGGGGGRGCSSSSSSILQQQNHWHHQNQRHHLHPHHPHPHPHYQQAGKNSSSVPLMMMLMNNRDSDCCNNSDGMSHRFHQQQQQQQQDQPQHFQHHDNSRKGGRGGGGRYHHHHSTTSCNGGDYDDPTSTMMIAEEEEEEEMDETTTTTTIMTAPSSNNPLLMDYRIPNVPLHGRKEEEEEEENGDRDVERGDDGAADNGDGNGHRRRRFPRTHNHDDDDDDDEHHLTSRPSSSYQQQQQQQQHPHYSLHAQQSVYRDQLQNHPNHRKYRPSAAQLQQIISPSPNHHSNPRNRRGKNENDETLMMFHNNPLLSIHQQQQNAHNPTHHRRRQSLLGPASPTSLSSILSSPSLHLSESLKRNDTGKQEQTRNGRNNDEERRRHPMSASNSTAGQGSENEAVAVDNQGQKRRDNHDYNKNHRNQQQQQQQQRASFPYQPPVAITTPTTAPAATNRMQQNTTPRFYQPPSLLLSYPTRLDDGGAAGDGGRCVYEQPDRYPYHQQQYQPPPKFTYDDGYLSHHHSAASTDHAVPDTSPLPLSAAAEIPSKSSTSTITAAPRSNSPHDETKLAGARRGLVLEESNVTTQEQQDDQLRQKQEQDEDDALTGTTTSSSSSNIGANEKMNKKKMHPKNMYIRAL